MPLRPANVRFGSEADICGAKRHAGFNPEILISETTRQEAGRILKVGRRMEVKAKGVEHAVTLFEVLGISGRYKLLLPDASEKLVLLVSSVPLRYEIVEASQLGHETYTGMLTKLSRKAAEAILDHPISNLTNIKMHLMQDGREIPGSLYAKVIDAVAGSGNAFSLRFTSVSPEIERFLLVQTAAGSNSIAPVAP